MAKHEQLSPISQHETDASAGLEVRPTLETRFDEADIERSYDLYSHLRELQDYDSPQLQGMEYEEFHNALLNPDCVKLHINDGGETIVIPALIPISETNWFSQEFFEDRYCDRGDPASKVYLLHHVPGLYEHLEDEYVSGMRGALRQAHANQAEAVVVDYPFNTESSIRLQLERLFSGKPDAYTADTDIAIEEDYLYKEGQPGFETHFAGKVNLLRPKHEQTTTSLNEAYRMAANEGLYDSNIETGVVVLDAIDQETFENIWDIYKQPFDDLTAQHPIRQGLTKQELFDILSDPETAKFAYREDGKIINLCMLTRNIGACEWLNEEFYAQKFPDEYLDGSVYYFPGLVTDNEHQGERHTQKTIQLLAEVIEYTGYEPIITFECCDTNSEFLPGLIEEVVKNTDIAMLEFDEVSKQSYRVFKIN